MKNPKGSPRSSADLSRSKASRREKRPPSLAGADSGTQRIRSYIFQTDDYSCGPVAIYNTLTALGHPPRCMRWIRADCDPHPDYGTLYDNFSKALLKYLPDSVNCEYIRQPNYEQVRDHVKGGGVVIICEHWKESARDSGEHYYTVVGMEGHNFLAANRDDCKNVQVITARNLKVSLIQYQLNEYPVNCQHKATEDDLIYPTVWLLSNTRKRKREPESGRPAKRRITS